MPRVRVIAHPVFARDGEPEGWRGWLTAGQTVFARIQQVSRGLAACIWSRVRRRRRQRRSFAPLAPATGETLGRGICRSEQALGWAGRLRSLAFNAGFFLLTALLGVLGLPLLLAPRRVVMRFGRFWARSVLALAEGDRRPRLRDPRPRQCSARPLHHRDEASIGLGHADPAGRAGRPGGRAEARAAVGAVLRLVRVARRIDRDRPRRPRGGAAPHGGGGPARRRQRDARS